MARVRFETRLHAHERNCSGLRWLWHTLLGVHVRIAEWDYQEASFLVDRAWDRYDALVGTKRKFIETPDPMSEVQK